MQYFCFADGEQQHRGIKKLLYREIREVVSKLCPLSLSEPASFLVSGTCSDNLIGYQDSTFWILKYLFTYLASSILLWNLKGIFSLHPIFDGEQYSMDQF